MVEAALVSVIIPVYNGEKFISEAIVSVRAQTYAPLELIVVDDGSTDQTAQVVQALGADIRYVYQPNQGPAAARNHGLALAQGELIAFLDADDLWPVDKLAHQVACLAVDEQVQLVWGNTQICPYQTDAAPTPPPAPNRAPLLGSLLCRRTVFQRVGLFEPTLRLGEDMDWLRRLTAAGIVVQLSPHLALFYRMRPGSLTYGRPSQDLGWFAIVRQALSQRRAAAEGVV